jgi:hypothetical protein
MGDSWVPPPFGISGKSKRLRDFVAWELTAPLVSMRGRDALQQICKDHAEFLWFAKLRTTDYFAINVTTVLDVLDPLRSDFRTFRGNVIEVKRAVFARTVGLPAIFKVPQSSSVYVTQSFVDVVLESSLRGLSLADPAVEHLPMVAKGQSINVVPGVEE